MTRYEAKVLRIVRWFPIVSFVAVFGSIATFSGDFLG